MIGFQSNLDRDREMANRLKPEGVDGDNMPQ